MVIKDTDPLLLRTISAALLEQKIVIMKCDTIYGIVGIAPETKEKIGSLKKRDPAKRFIMLIPDADWATRLSDQMIPAGFTGLWPGPLTLIVNGKSSETIAIRVPDDRLLAEILKRVGKPLFSTSVNLSNEKSLNNIEEIINGFGDTVDYIVDSGAIPDAIPSTIVDLTGIPYKIVRQGRMKIPSSLLE
jgi:L-threonylcarbamoyladenylate synthase